MIPIRWNKKNQLVGADKGNVMRRYQNEKILQMRIGCVCNVY